MASEKGPVGAVLLGSVFRHVLRRARCPVWVVHPEVKKARRRRKKVEARRAGPVALVAKHAA
jgi:hypothetical protein